MLRMFFVKLCKTKRFIFAVGIFNVVQCRSYKALVSNSPSAYSPLFFPIVPHITSVIDPRTGARQNAYLLIQIYVDSIFFVLAWLPAYTVYWIKVKFLVELAQAPWL